MKIETPVQLVAVWWKSRDGVKNICL